MRHLIGIYCCVGSKGQEWREIGLSEYYFQNPVGIHYGEEGKRNIEMTNPLYVLWTEKDLRNLVV